MMAPKFDASSAFYGYLNIILCKKYANHVLYVPQELEYI